MVPELNPTNQNYRLQFQISYRYSFLLIQCRFLSKIQEFRSNLTVSRRRHFRKRRLINNVSCTTFRNTYRLTNWKSSIFL